MHLGRLSHALWQWQMVALQATVERQPKSFKVNLNRAFPTP